MGRITSSSSASTIGIKDTAGNALTSSSGALDINVISTTPSFPQETLSIFSEVAGIATGAFSTILSYTVPAGKTLYLNKILVSGNNISSFDLEFDAVTNARKRLTYTVFNETFDYSLNGNIGGYKITTGTIVSVIATNLSQSGLADFNATLQGVLQ